MEDKDSLAQMASGASVAFIMSIIGFGLMFLFKLFAARYFGPHEFGVFSLLEAILGVTLLVSGLGLNKGIPRYIPYYLKKTNYSYLKGYIRYVTILSLVSSVIFAALIYIFSATLTSFFGFPLEFSRFLELLAFIIPLKVLDGVFRKSLHGYKKIGYAKFSAEVLEKGILMLGIGIIWFLHLELIWLVIFYLAGKGLPLILDYFWYRSVRVKKKVSAHYLGREWFTFSFPLLLSGVFAFMIGWTDNILIGRFLEPDLLGIYAIVFSLAGLLKFFQKSFTVIFLPLISENLVKGKGASFLFKKASSWVFGLSLPIALVLIFFGSEVLSLLYGPQYSVGYTSLIIISLAFLINVGSGMGSQILMLHKKTKSIFYVNVIIAFMNITLNLILIPLMGIVGAAIASGLSISLQNIIFYYNASRLESLPIDWRYYAKFMIAGLPAVIIASLVFRAGLPELFAAVIAIAVYGGLYLLFLLLLRTFTKDDFYILLLFEKKLGLNLKPIKSIVKKFY